MPMPGLSIVKAGTLLPATVTYQTNATTSVNAFGYTFSGQSIGTETSDRRVIVGWSTIGNATLATSMFIGGISASLPLYSTLFDSGYGLVISAGFGIANVPTGTTASIVINFDTTVNSCSIGILSTTQLVSSVPHATDTDGLLVAGTHSLSVDVPAGGIVVGHQAHWDNTFTSRSWTGITERYDAFGVEQDVYSGAASAFATAQTVSVGVDNPSPTGSLAIAASWR